MASKNSASLALFFAINILFVTLTAATDCGYCDPKPKPVPSPRPRPVPSPSVPSYNPRPIIPPRTPRSYGNCPIDTLKLSVCADVLGGLLNIQLGQPSCKPCCSLIEGLVDLDAAVCLCTGLRANILGINLNIPISLSLLLNACNRKLPYGFQCA